MPARPSEAPRNRKRHPPATRHLNEIGMHHKRHLPVCPPCGEEHFTLETSTHPRATNINPERHDPASSSLQREVCCTPSEPRPVGTGGDPEYIVYTGQAEGWMDGVEGGHPLESLVFFSEREHSWATSLYQYSLFSHQFHAASGGHWEIIGNGHHVNLADLGLAHPTKNWCPHVDPCLVEGERNLLSEYQRIGFVKGV